MVTQHILSEVTGSIWKIEVTVGQTVVEGDTVMIVESMKMEIPVTAHCTGVVQELRVQEGEAVSEDQCLAVLG